MYRMYWKTKNCFFRTPLVISKFVNSPEEEKCWRGSGKVGDHTYILGISENIYILARGKESDYKHSAYRLDIYSPVFLA